MGDNRAGSVLGNVKNVAADIDKLISSALANSARIATNAANTVQGYWGSRAQSGSSTTVMSQPIPGAAASGSGQGGSATQVMAPAGSSSGGGIGLQQAMAGMGYAFSAMPGVQTQIMQNQMATRVGFFGYGSGGKDARYDQAQALQLSMLRGGTATSTLDPAFAMMAGQAAGIGTGLRNYNNIAAGVMSMSNTVPGIGLEGTMQAYAGLQQGRSVNIMRAMGVSARDAQGNPRSYTEIANQIWSKINREKSVGRAITKEDIANGLLPGNSLDNMLTQIAGNNQALRSQLESAILAKASGAKDFSKGEMNRVGGMSDYTVAASNRTAAAGDTLYQTSRAGAAGATFGAETATAMSNFANALNSAIPILSALAGVKGATETIGGAGNGVVGKLFSLLLGKLPGKAAGGSVGESNAYMVGEKGPELFVPTSNGTIIPNNKLNFAGFRAGGGDVSPTSWANSLITGLGATATPGAVDALTTWMRFEGGHWKNSAAFNPLNTTLDMPGSHSMNPVGVEAYTNWQQGLDATIATLTGKKAGARGYTDIVNAIKAGASKEDILKAINNSSWRTGKAGGSGSYKFAGSSSDYNPAGAYSASAVGSGMSTTLKSLLQSTGGTSGMAGGVVNNMGGVSITIVGDKDPKKTAEAVKKILTDEGVLKRVSAT